MPQPAEHLPPADDTSEDTLSLPAPVLSDRELEALLMPGPGSFVRGTGQRLLRPADRHITGGASLSDAVLEDRG